MKKLTHTHFTQQLELMRTERSNLYPLWQDLSDYHMSHRGRFLKGEQKDLANRPTRQVNNTSRLASRTTASGMMAGITSPGRPWFRLQAPDPDLNEVAAVKQWLHEVMVTMNRVFSQSNTYNSLHTLYGELATFGTGAMGVYPDFENVIRCKTHTIGSYFLGMGGHNDVNQFYREYTMSVGEVVQRFGIDNVRNSTKQLWNSNNLTAQIRIIHCIEPNDDRNMISPLASDKAYRSVYFEQDTSGTQLQSSARGNSLDDTDKYLLRSGFNIFPELTPRWEVTGEDVYGSDCPGMTCLGDTKSLQLLERRKFQAIQKVAAPPLQGDTDIVNRIKDSGLEPDEHIAVTKDQRPLESVYGNYRPDINQLRTEIDNTENRISRAYYEDLFLMLSNSNRRQITATEVAERQEEKLLMLGPVLQRLHHELLDPLINITFERLQGAGVLPPPPPELDDVELGVEYVSVLAQAQRLVAVGGIERLTGFVSSAAQLDPSARHKLDLSQAIDEYGLALGVNPRIVRGDSDVAKIVQGEQQQQQAAAALDQASQAAALAEQGQNIETGDDSNVTKDLLASAGLG